MRDFLENFIECPDEVISLGTHLEFSLAWFVLFLWLAAFLHLVSRESMAKISKLMVYGFLVIFIAPLFDLVYYRGQDFMMNYVLSDPLHNFLTFYSGCKYGHQATMGIRVEIALGTILAVIYTAGKTRDWARSLTAGAGVYAITFVWMSWPAIYHSFFPHTHHPGKPVPAARLPYPDAYIRFYLSVLIVMIPVYLRMLGFRVDRMSFKLDLPGLKVRPSAFISLVRNIRPLRVVHYGVFVIIGFLIGKHEMHAKPAFMDIWHLGLLLCSVLCAWAFAVGINDIYDQNIDKVSNPGRPLIAGLISPREYAVSTAVFAVMSLMLAWAVSYWSASIIFYFLVYYSFVYSAPPLRLRRYLFLPNILIGVCSLLCVLLGFSIFGGFQTFSLFPKRTAFFIVLAFTLGSTVKDLKDYEGDRMEGITTLPTLLGLPLARVFVAFFISAMFAVTPFFIKIQNFWIYSSSFSAVSFYVVLKKSEQAVFGLWFVFAAVFAFQFAYKYIFIS
jgi:homogentisate phytyltransferase/homogentisate geranylgeranyltransferase